MQKRTYLWTLALWVLAGMAYAQPIYHKFHVQLASNDPNVTLGNRNVTVQVQSLGAVATLNLVTDTNGYAVDSVSPNYPQGWAIASTMCNNTYAVDSAIYPVASSQHTYFTLRICDTTVVVPPPPPPPAPRITGRIWAGNNFGFPVRVWAITTTYDSSTTPPSQVLAAVDSTQTDSAGYYVFFNLPDNIYLVKAAPVAGTLLYTTHLPTYHQSSVLWSGATDVNVSNILGTPGTIANIFLIPGVNTAGGPGFIGGNVNNGANKTNAGLAGIRVFLMDGSGTPMGFAMTDGGGNYSFSNLPYGTYQIVADVLGRVATPINISLSATNPNATDIDLVVTPTTVSAAEGQLPVSSLTLFPNPAQGQSRIRLNALRDMDLTVSVVDLTGRSLWQTATRLGQGNNELELNTANLPAGLYLVNLRSGSAQQSLRLQKVD